MGPFTSVCSTPCRIRRHHLHLLLALFGSKVQLSLEHPTVTTSHRSQKVRLCDNSDAEMAQVVRDYTSVLNVGNSNPAE